MSDNYDLLMPVKIDQLIAHLRMHKMLLLLRIFAF